ncbi:MAG: YqeG family HAD IIIA-type phosphatase [Lachnospiraceae bacterium]|nr:YqeG family HAD IIIA-type phosphatase [Lachnospiraceae bacterium]
MKHTWYPDDYVASTYQIDFAQLAKEGYRGVIFDVDNTLVEHNAPADERAIAFFTMLHDNGYKALLLSNNAEPRVQSFKKASGADAYIYKAGKPSPKSYQKAMEILGTTPETTLFVGDQIFTDIWGANLAGIRSIMVKPVHKWKEEIQIIIKRFAEAIVLFFYHFYAKNEKNIKRVPLLDKET